MGLSLEGIEVIQLRPNVRGSRLVATLPGRAGVDVGQATGRRRPAHIRPHCPSQETLGRDACIGELCAEEILNVSRLEVHHVERRIA